MEIIQWRIILSNVSRIFREGNGIFRFICLCVFFWSWRMLSTMEFEGFSEAYAYYVKE